MITVPSAADRRVIRGVEGSEGVRLESDSSQTQPVLRSAAAIAAIERSNGMRADSSPSR
jgi:hypothetical protein